MNENETKAQTAAIGFVDGLIDRAERREAFRKELASLLNRHSMENGSNTPDFLLADYLIQCLKSLDEAIKMRDGHYGYRQFTTVIVGKQEG